MNEKYKRVIFQLNELLRDLLIDSSDIKEDKIEEWFKQWDKIENDNQDVYNEIYCE